MQNLASCIWTTDRGSNCLHKALSGGLTLLLFLVFVVTGCHAAGGSPINLTSSDLKDGKVPAAQTCDGVNVSPQLSWNAPPAGTKSLALVVADPDAPSGTFTHWVLFNLPPTERSLPEGVPQSDQLSTGARQGGNDFGKTGYGGPCPPHNSEHRYIFTLYALDTLLDLPAGASRSQVEAAMKGHILAHGGLTARYGR
jgi:hypothetical protein